LAGLGVINPDADENDIYFAGDGGELQTIDTYNKDLIDTFVSGTDRENDGTYVAKYDHSSKTVIESDVSLDEVVYKPSTSSTANNGYLGIFGATNSNAISASTLQVDNIVTGLTAGEEDDIAFIDATGQLKTITGFNSASFVSGTNGTDETQKLSTYDGRSLQQTSITANTVLTSSAGHEGSITFYGIDGKLTTFADADITHWNNVAFGNEFSNDTEFLAVYNSGSNTVQATTKKISDFLLSGDLEPVYTIVLMVLIFSVTVPSAAQYPLTSEGKSPFVEVVRNIRQIEEPEESN
jgi:hypothetical protein